MSSVPWFAGIVVAVAWLSMLSLVLRRDKRDAEVWFAIFCGSIAMSFLRPELFDQSAWLVALVTVLSCATCNVYWLFARSLFRGPGAVRMPHIAVALAIAMLIVLLRWAQRDDPAGSHGSTIILSAVLNLASTTVLALAFLEPLRGISTTSHAERRFRMAFMTCFGSCVVTGSMLTALAEHDASWQNARQIANGSCALLMIAFSHFALHFRRTQEQRTKIVEAQSAESASASISEAAQSPQAAPSADDQTLADAIIALLDSAAFREPQLKVADLAARLHSSEHKVSRVITHVLGERNFNQLINRYRIAYACEQLLNRPDASVIEISMDSGFASLGPFNRAFKAAMGCTPSDYRAKGGAMCEPPLAMLNRVV
jgi:AraC-like DNA-binding protein